MDHTQFPWRRLGALLVERGLLTASELEHALAEQRRSGRLLGQVLVGRGYVSGTSLVGALAEQHGVTLQPTSAAETQPAAGAPPVRPEGPWRPLGRVLVDLGLLSKTDLEQVLAEQRQDPERRLGEILVAGDYVTGPELALALAEQHGVELDREDELQTVVASQSPPQPTYRVFEVVYEPTYRPGKVLHESAGFLEAADFACEHVQREQPAALEIEKVDGPVRETVWTYSEARASATDAAREKLVGTFGFDPVRWDTGGQLSSGTKPS
jgi:hypothetical protein